MNPHNQNPNTSTRNPPLTSIGPGGSTNTQACAACKYQRRRCAPDCPLAPYFPPNRPQEFLNTRRLFGVSNIAKVIQSVHPPAQEVAVKSMIYQANVRALDPVGGCYRMIKDLEKRINQSKAELDFVVSQLAYLRASQNDDAAAVAMQNPNFEYDNHEAVHEMNINDGVQNDYMGLGFNVDAFEAIKFDNGASSSGSSSFVLQRNKRVPPLAMEELDDVKPLQKVKVESRKSIQSSAKVVLKENVVPAIQPPKQPQKQEENDLKGAASLFSLTNCNA